MMSSITGIPDHDEIIVGYAHKFTLTQLASVNRRFLGLVKALGRKIRAPDNFTWFIGAVAAGGLEAVDAYLQRYPGHVSEHFSLFDFGSRKLVEWVGLTGELHENTLDACALAISLRDEDMTMLLLLHGASLMLSEYRKYARMPRVIAKYGSIAGMTDAITGAFAAGDMHLLSEFVRLIPGVVRGMSTQPELQALIKQVHAIPDMPRITFAIDNGWTDVRMSVRILNQYKRRDLVKLLRQRYNI